MSTFVSPFILDIPETLLIDPQERFYFQYLNRFCYEIYTRTGGGIDSISSGQAQIDALISLSGVSTLSVNLGSFTGAIIPNDQTIKQAFQSLETSLETTNTNVTTAQTNINNLVTLSGVALNATSLGTFTGTTIADNVTIKVALQSLETYAESTAGTVTSVSGTANRITSTGGVAPVIDISASYVGQTSITTLGTITTGTWTGTTIAVLNGGTGQTSYTNGQLLIGNTTGNTLTKATLTAGTNIAITNGTGSITIDVTGTVSSATNATNIAVTDDTATNATMYPLWVTANTGNLPAKVSSTKLSFNPSTGILTSTGFSGPINGTIGATTPNTSSFTTIAASGALTSTSTGSFTATAPTNALYVKGTGAVTTAVLNVELDDSNGTAPALKIRNLTNWAQSGSLVTITASNGTDSGALLVLTNAGTGKYIDCSTNFSVTKGGLTSSKRFAGLGTALATTDFAASANWGTAPTKTVVQGTDAAGIFTITAQATTGADPTITLTFKDGTWTNAPTVAVCGYGLMTATGAPTASVSNRWIVTSVTATTFIVTYNGTPVAANTYGFAFHCIGR